MFSKMKILESTKDYSDKINLIADKMKEADVPSEIKFKSICIDADIAEVVTMLKEVME